MIFRPELVHKILIGRKSETRRPCKPGEMACTDPYLRTYVLNANGVQRWIEEGTYALQTGRGKAGVGKIRIESIHSEYVQSISPQAAILEGFNSVQEFQQAWDSIYADQPQKQWAANPEVWVIRFALVRESVDESAEQLRMFE